MSFTYPHSTVTPVMNSDIYTVKKMGFTCTLSVITYACAKDEHVHDITRRCFDLRETKSISAFEG